MGLGKKLRRRSAFWGPYFVFVRPSANAAAPFEAYNPFSQASRLDVPFFEPLKLYFLEGLSAAFRCERMGSNITFHAMACDAISSRKQVMTQRRCETTTIFSHRCGELSDEAKLHFSRF